MFRSPDNTENDASYLEDDYQQSSIIENEATQYASEIGCGVYASDVEPARA